ncbi:MAG: RHS repeat-associated core domain-containing protein, partial [Clostridia bacterium]|nr:RHS repeat-associated core domain-containing protein [Clostridia bacterium]
FRYCGEYYDVETGFIYLRARYYDPMVGRFTSVDPIKDGLNWYAYCYNNPVAYIDPSGKEPVSLIIFSLAILGFALLTGCSAKSSSPPEDFRGNYNAYANCYTYVLSYAFPEGAFTFDKSLLIDPGFFSWLAGNDISMYSDNNNKYEVEEIADFVKLDIDSAGFPMRQIESPDELEEDEYLIALKTSDIIIEDTGFADYHFAIQLSDGTWVDKPGNTPPRWNVIRSPYDDWDYGTKNDEGFIKGYYNSGPIFFALKKGGY